MAIEGVDRHAYQDLFDQMFRMRAAVFSDRLGWDVTVIDGKEIDRFDGEDPLYLLCVDELTQELKGSVRLLPTTGPYMLRDVFAVLVPDGSVESPLIWESSRFALNPLLSVGPNRKDANRVVNTTTIELLCGLVEAAQLAGVEHIVSVFDARMARIFRAADCPYELIGVPARIGKTMTYAGLFEISDSMRRRLGAAGGLHAPLLASAGAGLAAVRSA
ncbi:MAG: acyl-homoserine-lactone synthase [Devosia sp.]